VEVTGPREARNHSAQVGAWHCDDIEAGERLERLERANTARCRDELEFWDMLISRLKEPR
jgi:hypothetical protein